MRYVSHNKSTDGIMLEEKKKLEEKERGDESFINSDILAEVSNNPGDEKR